jgi:hypothetical protein
MQRPITGFHQDADRRWIAELECGHQQHVRHNPPWEIRPWVLTEAARREKIGAPLDCVMCRVPFTYRSRPG